MAGLKHGGETTVFGKHCKSPRDTEEYWRSQRYTTTRSDSYQSIKFITAPHPTWKESKARGFHPRQDWELPAQKGILSKQPQHMTFSEQQCNQEEFFFFLLEVVWYSL